MTFGASRAAGVAVLAALIASPLASCTSARTQSSNQFSTPTSSSAVKSAISTVTSAPTPTATASLNPTIADYITTSHIQQIVIHRGDADAPTIDVPVPQGWIQPPQQDAAAYGLILWAAASNPKDPPTIRAMLTKLDGHVDADQILTDAPNELENLPGYSGGDGQTSQLSGFPAYALSGTYSKDGARRAVAQKTVIIHDHRLSGLFLLQLNADGPAPDQQPLMDATSVIDDHTTITP